MGRFLIAAVVLLSGCATLFGDKDRTVKVESEPKGAKVLLNGLPIGRTPTTVTVTNMLQSNTLTFKKEGYETMTVPIATSFQPVAVLNLFNLICWAVDVGTGNIMRIDSKMIEVELDKEEKTASFPSYSPQFATAAENPAQCQFY